MHSSCAGRIRVASVGTVSPGDILMRGLLVLVGLLALVSSCGFNPQPKGGTSTGGAAGVGTPPRMGNARAWRSRGLGDPGHSDGGPRHHGRDDRC